MAGGENRLPLVCKEIGRLKSPVKWAGGKT